MECSTCSCFLPSRKHSASRRSRFRRWSVWRSRTAPPSELIVPPSKRATISRFPQASNPKPDWLHSVIAKAVLSLALTAVWKLSYAMKDGLLPIAGEKSGLEVDLQRTNSNPVHSTNFRLVPVTGTNALCHWYERFYYPLSPPVFARQIWVCSKL